MFSKVTLENEIEAEIQEQVDRKVKKEVVTEEEEGLKIEEEMLIGALMGEEVLVEETQGVKAMARSNLYLRQASTPKVPLPYNSTSPIFWRPWEATCEATARRSWSGEVTTTTTMLHTSDDYNVVILIVKFAITIHVFSEKFRLNMPLF